MTVKPDNIELADKGDILREYIDNAKNTLRLLITKKCNSKCIYCYEEGIPNSRNNQPQNLDLEDFENIIKTGKELGVKRVSISGGEPTLYFEWVEELVELCHKKGLLVYLTTNATNRRIISLAKKYPKLEFRISLDCSSREQYKQLRNIDNFDEVISILQELCNLKNEIHINRVICSLDNEWEEFNNMINLFVEKKLNMENKFLRLIPCYPNKFSSRIEVIDYIDYLSKYISELKTKLHQKNFQFMYEFKYKGVNCIIRTRGIYSPKCCPVNDKRCVEGIAYTRINPDGLIQPCFGAFLKHIKNGESIESIKKNLAEGREFLDSLYIKESNDKVYSYLGL